MKTKFESRGDRIYNAISYILLTLAVFVVIYPLYFIVIASFSDPNMVLNGKVWLLPKGINFEGYKYIFKYNDLWLGYRNSIFYTVAGTFINLALTLPCAYALSRKELYGRSVITAILAFTMYFSGGLIPTFLLVLKLGIYNTVWAMLIIGGASVWNIIISRTFFSTNIPSELREAAMIDGCKEFGFFLKIALPLSRALIAVMVLLYGAGHWNSYFKALVYLRNADLRPLQLVLREILVTSQSNAAALLGDFDQLEELQKLSEMIKYGVIIFASIPLLVAYPFLQKYFAQGVMIGAIKG
jgi:putative aldouronate transport system permease protein